MKHPYLNRYFILSFFLLLGIILMSHILQNSLGILNIALLHLIPIVLVALMGNMSATVIVAGISVVAFDLLHVPPEFSFNFEDAPYLLSFAIFFCVGYIITFQAKRIQQNTIKETILNTLSHDLKTPLSSILGNTTFLLQNNNLDRALQEEVLLELKNSSERMNRLIINLLDSARLQSGKNALRLEWCDLEDMIGVALQEFDTPQLIDRIKIDVKSNLPLFYGDCTLLARLFVNLIDNALKYSQEGEVISVSIAYNKNELNVLFFNRCMPIKKADLKNMFEKFRRLDNTYTEIGNGIGLTICKEIVQAHQGTIEAYNKEDGLAIDVRLPFIKSSSLLEK